MYNFVSVFLTLIVLEHWLFSWSSSSNKMSSQLQTNLIAAAIGATIGVISAASIFIYQKVLEKQQHAMKNAHLDEVDRRLTELQTELERLR